MDRAAAILRAGGLVAFPTETVYGLGAVAFDETAVARIFEAKKRPRFDPLIVHVCEPDALARLTADVPAAARTLIARFWPGPLTLVLPKAPGVPDLVTAGLPTVAVRMPRHPLALELIRRTGMPLAAPSANPFGHVSPTTARHVLDHLAGQVDLVLDGGPCPVGVESTIVSFAAATPALLRHGGLPQEEIEAWIGPLATAAVPASSTPSAPGMLPQHYAPRTRLRLVSESPAPPAHPRTRVGLLAFQTVPAPGAFAAVEVLSARGDLREAAARLFGALRRLDERQLDLILAESVPEIGLGRAINDRLRRAAGPRQSGGR